MKPKTRVILACAAMWAAALSPGGAQEAARTTGLRMDSGLRTYFTGPGKSTMVTVTELGAGTAESTVRIVFLDAQDRPVLRGGGVLKRGQPVSLELPLSTTAAPSRLQLRVSVSVIGPIGRGSRPAAVWEGLDALSLVSWDGWDCAPPFDDDNNVIPMCDGGGRVSSFAVGP